MDHARDRKPTDIQYYLDRHQRAQLLAHRRLTESITFKATPDMRRVIEHIAAAAGISPSDVIRNAIDHAVPIMAEELAKRGRSMRGP